jgi:2,3-bisphosphoglycerate-independent phosphoglycerate mutase
MKTILVLLDGLGDRSYGRLDHQTPLQAAGTPHLNRLAKYGSNGLWHASSVGECLPSEMAHFLFFGYDRQEFPGRGLLEAVGDDVPFDDQDVLVLAHLAGVAWSAGVPILEMGRDDIQGTRAELGALFAAVSAYEAEGIQFQLHQTHRNDAILVMQGKVSSHISDSDPIVRGQPIGRVVALSDCPEPIVAAKTAKGLNRYLEYCHAVLTDLSAQPVENHAKPLQANFLATQRSGRRIPQEPFEQRWGLKGMMVASGSVYAGLAHELGIDFVWARDTDAPGRDLRERIQIALDDSKHDFVHVHTKAPDQAAHHGDPLHKQNIISGLDKGLDVLVQALDRHPDLQIVVTADHSTPCESVLVHSGEPVPVVMVGPNVRRDGVERFDEVSAAAGGLGNLRGRELMLMILNNMDRSVLAGHQLGPDNRLYWGGEYPVFKKI